MERLRVVRQKQHLTQKDIAAFLGIDRTTYVKYETGKSEPSFETLQKIADFFSVSTAPGPDLYSIQGIGPISATKKVPRLGTIACGEPILAVENIEEYDDAPSGVSCDFTLLCKGDSMIGARILDGDIVYIRGGRRNRRRIDRERRHAQTGPAQQRPAYSLARESRLFPSHFSGA